MTGSLPSLFAAAFVFVGSHFLLSASAVRTRAVATIGEWPFRTAYSAVALVSFAWLLLAYGDAPAQELWEPPVGLRHLALGIMPVACLLLVAGYTSVNPSAVGMERMARRMSEPTGVFRITRHPILWAIGLWALVHLVANGGVAELILFGALGILALGGALHLDVRKRVETGEAWTSYVEATSNVPFAAILLGRQRLSIAELRLWRIVTAALLFAGLMVVHADVTGMPAFVVPD